MIYYLIAAAVIVFDRVVKKLVVSNMVPWETIPVIEDIFHFTYVQNRGAAFSMWQGQWIILIGFPLAAIAVGLILIYLKRNKWDKLMLTSVAMICGGGLGNLIDRIMLGYVVDLFDFRVFPVFNIADIFICVGCGLMILDVLFFERKNSSNE
ncbi:MAG: signal peptidase II [Firmicutes bacterium]|nr:signal peptidase II [Bacillota bacterium]